MWLRFWLDDVGDGLLAGSTFVTLTTATLAGLALLPGIDRWFAERRAAEEALAADEVGAPEQTVRMLLPLPAALAEPVADAVEAAAPALEEVAEAAAEAASAATGAVAEVGGGGTGGVSAARKAGVEVPSKKGRRCDAPPDPGIVQTGPLSFTVDRAVVKRYSSDWSRLDELGWSRSHDGADGKADGMLIGGVRCGSDLHDAGIRSGDVVHAVNGRKVKNLAQALLVYGAVKNDPVIRVELTRRGEPVVLTYRLSDRRSS